MQLTVSDMFGLFVQCSHVVDDVYTQFNVHRIIHRLFTQVSFATSLFLSVCVDVLARLFHQFGHSSKQDEYVSPP